MAVNTSKTCIMRHHRKSSSLSLFNIIIRASTLLYRLVSMVLGFLSSASPAVKWLGFVCAVWVQAVAGNNDTFSNYSDALKSLMVLNQLQLNNLSVAKDVGKAFGILAGLVSDKLPISIILIVGAVEGLLGYGAQWLVVSQKIRPLPYWQVCILSIHLFSFIFQSFCVSYSLLMIFGTRWAYFFAWEATVRRG